MRYFETGADLFRLDVGESRYSSMRDSDRTNGPDAVSRLLRSGTILSVAFAKARTDHIYIERRILFRRMMPSVTFPNCQVRVDVRLMIPLLRQTISLYTGRPTLVIFCRQEPGAPHYERRLPPCQA